MVQARLEWAKVLEDVGPTMADRLEAARRRDPFFQVIAVPSQGFSDSDLVHNSVIDFCRRNSIRLFNPGAIVARLERALPGKTLPGHP
jgi:hypothetical protein